MADGDGDEKPQTDPATLQTPQAQPDTETRGDQVQPATREQARRFLQEPDVQKQTTERKADFLRSKGITESEIRELLEEAASEPRTEASSQSIESKDEGANPKQTRDMKTIHPAEKKEDRPPIITYPEFLTKPVRPPPLITVNGFLNTLYAFGGFSTLLYGTSKYVVEPMVQSLTEARISLHETAKEDLRKLVEKLETVVSEIPPTAKKAELAVGGESYRDEDEKSSYDDPTELFHRDIGVQTSLPSSPVPRAAELAPPESASAQQARRLTELVASVKAISDGLVSQTEDFGDTTSVLAALRDDVTQLSAAHHQSYASGFATYGGNRDEPDDETKKAKENIRRVKGVLLSSRNFPASSR
ncbi:peroxisomal membrane protein PEX14 [Echria macrotheca]|uniref:Peroxisomal membrane protein PEX14 n=1 Tax=Echria macrotheca TaxID=438768 RepID=A0AAJ0B9T1_9PEZI|nr:peroxisomal membrane protein PEX14 [Echria macrotheca]